MEFDAPPGLSDEEVTAWLLRRAVCTHLDDPEDKFQTVVFMVKKLFALAQDKCVVEGVDSIMMHEIILGGHLYLQLIKDRLAGWLGSLKFAILQKAKMAKSGAELKITPQYFLWAVKKTGSFEKMFENFLGTGNLPTTANGLGLMQDKGRKKERKEGE